jgi:hypothetical protein
LSSNPHRWITYKIWGKSLKEFSFFSLAIYHATRENNNDRKPLTRKEVEKIIDYYLNVYPSVKEVIKSKNNKICLM